MAEMTIDQLKDRIQQLENRKSLFEKTGEIIYIHDPEAPTANFKKIMVGIDASAISPSGKLESDFFPLTITGYRKDLFKQFDQTDADHEFNVGDRVTVLCDATNFQVSEETFPRNSQTKRQSIFANNNLVKIKLIEKAAKLPSEKPENADFFAGGVQGSAGTDDLPF